MSDFNGTAPGSDNPTYRIAELERKVDTLSWLHAELVYALRLSAAIQYAQSVGPQLQQQVVDQIMSGQITAPA